VTTSQAPKPASDATAPGTAESDPDPTGPEKSAATARAEPATTPKPAKTPSTKPGPKIPEGSIVLMNGNQTGLLKSKEGNAVKPLPDESGVQITSSLEKPASGGSTEGAFLTIGEDIEKEFSGQPIKITVAARRSAENGADSFAVAYSTAKAGNSGWQTFKLTDDYALYEFDYTPATDLNGSDFVGIWADTTGSGKGVDVLFVAAQ
jgi:hypothetical protein